MAGGAELLVSQGKDGWLLWKASCLLLAPLISSLNQCWKVLLAGLQLKEAEARVRKVQASMEQNW